MEYDFSGYVTKNNIRCTDGRTIRKNAFVDCDGLRVPLVWQHKHDTPITVIGHADLEHRNDGIYGYCKFNSTPAGKHSKELVKSGDIKSLSIWANHVVQQGMDVVHGSIKEVSLVYSGANPGAYIDNVVAHSDGMFEVLEDEIKFCTGEEIVLENGIMHEDYDEEQEETTIEHSDDSEESKSDDETIGDIFNTLTDKQKDCAYYLIGIANGETLDDFAVNNSTESKPVQHADDGGETVGDVFESMTEKQKKAVLYLVKKAVEDTLEHSDEGVNTMNVNVFDGVDTSVENEIMHADEFVNDAISCALDTKATSLRDVIISHADDAQDYGIRDIDHLFPDAQLVNKKIEMLRNNPTDWVSKVINGVRKSPLSRIKMLRTTELTGEEARAKGYVKGTQKVSEVIGLAKRVIGPTTIYKMQKLDRDDIIDVTDIDVVAWLKAEMRLMLDEEIARQVLISDFRVTAESLPYKIADGTNNVGIRPIIKDYASDLFAYRHFFTVSDSEDIYAKFVDEVTMSMIKYEGSGNPALYLEPAFAARLLLIKNSLGERMYKTESELCAAMGVSSIIRCPYFKDEAVTVEGEELHSMYIPTEGESSAKMHVRGIVVNLDDYTIGADKGGSINLFDDFDIDFNQYKYLMETRCSGSLTKIRSAALIGEVVAA